MAAVEVVVPEVTSVSDTRVAVHWGPDRKVYDGLAPDTEYSFDGVTFRTLRRPVGERLATLATVNDVHFGETVCGVIKGDPDEIVFSVEPGEAPYPETMNEGAIAEMLALEPAADAVIVKGDLTSNGTAEEYQRFLEVYRGAFGDRLHHVRGNHESYNLLPDAAWPTQSFDVPGARVAIIDTSRERRPNGSVSDEQVEWLGELGSGADRPVIVFGHHHVWDPTNPKRTDSYFGIVPDDSEKLIDVFARTPRLVGYFAGHTHRNRVRRFAATGEVPWVEVASVKDYPGTWAEYRIYETEIMQVHHRISAPAALAWTERTRAMHYGLYADYAFGKVEDRNFLFPTTR